MNSETSLLVILTLAVLILALVFGFAQGVGSEVKNVILGDSDNKGFLNCNPVTGKNCGSNSETEDTGSLIDSGVVVSRV